ncbi:MAG: YtxH domain-containing protein [Pyrinomonadaceae bacterium]
MSRENDSDVTTKLTYLLIGGGIGAVLALLFAPKSGQELRGDIADATRKGIDRTRETASQVGARAGEYYEVGRQRAGEYYDATREKAQELYATATDKAGEYVETAKEVASRTAAPLTAAVEAGKNAYVEEKRKTASSAIAGGGPNYPDKKEV